MNNVERTYNYEKFQLCDWNREISSKNLKTLDSSVQKNGWLQHPILVNENMEIVDGQHRFVYAKEHNLPVYYVVVPGLTVVDCVTMNNSRRSWTLIDYIRFFANQGNDNYIILKNIVERYSFAPVNVLANIIKNTGLSGAPAKAIKEGLYEITTKEYKMAVEKLDFLQDLVPYIFSVPGRASSILYAVSFCYDLQGISRKRLAKQVRNYIGLVTPPANLEMALKEVEKLYNYNGRKADYVYIYTEYKKMAADRQLNGPRSRKTGGQVNGTRGRRKDGSQIDLCE